MFRWPEKVMVVVDVAVRVGRGEGSEITLVLMFPASLSPFRRRDQPGESWKRNSDGVMAWISHI